MMKKLLRAAVILCGAGLLPGCGVTVPTLNPIGPNDYNPRIFVQQLATHVHCELGQALRRAVAQANAPWLKDWAGVVTLTITVDEKSSLAPGLSLTDLMPTRVIQFGNGTTLSGAQSFNFGLGGSVGADGNRVLLITWYLVFADLINEPEVPQCAREAPYPIEGDLKIWEGLEAGVYTASVWNTVSNPYESGGPLAVIQHHVTFEVDMAGSATPSWRLVNVSVNPASPFLSGSRSKKDDLLITMGPSDVELDSKRKLKRRVPSQAVISQSQATQTGNAVGTAIQQITPF